MIARLISVSVAVEFFIHINNFSISTKFDSVKVAAEKAARDEK